MRTDSDAPNERVERPERVELRERGIWIAPAVMWPALLLGLEGSTSPLLALGSLTFAVSALAGCILWKRLRRVQRELHEARVGMAARLELHAVDEITKVLTRRGFVERAERILAGRKPGEGMVFLAVDLDFLKEINDSFGHKAGDAILQRLASVLAGLSPDALVGRIGGDEFAMLMPCREAAELERFRRHLFDALAHPVETGGRSISISASVGAVLLPAQALYLTQAMQFADLALYEAKRRGRGCLFPFDEDMLRALKRHRLIERELRAALLLDELAVHYQPIVNGEGEIFALEALLRWESPSRGMISPAEFIRVAESSTLIDQIGAWVLERACRDALDFDGVRVCVNVSAVQLKRDDVVHAVADTLRRTGLAADRLIVELTESVAIETTPAIQERLSRLRAMGVTIALDDFGTGFSGFDYLRHLPVDKIKIDRSYVAKLGESEADNVLVSALANVGRAMHMMVVAEGIETPEQLLLAKAAGCALFQGYHIARPASKEDMVARCRSTGPRPPLASNGNEIETKRARA